MQLGAGSVQGVDYQNGKLKNYANVKDHICAMQEGRCALCGQPMDKNNYHCHQLLDQSKGGSDRVHNCIGWCTSGHRQIQLYKA